MTKLTLTAILSIALLSFTTTEWMQFRNIDGRFKILTRGNLEEKVAEIPTALGNIKTHVFTYRPKEKEENLLYRIVYYDFPEGGMHSDSTELIKEFFNSTVEEAVTSVNGLLVYENELTHQEYPARQWRVNYNDNQVAIRSRAIIVKNRFYLLQTVSLTDVDQNNVTEYFINSFLLLGE